MPSSDAVVPSSAPAEVASPAPATVAPPTTWTSLDMSPPKIFRLLAGATHPEAAVLEAGPAGSICF